MEQFLLMIICDYELGLTIGNESSQILLSTTRLYLAETDNSPTIIAMAGQHHGNDQVDIQIPARIPGHALGLTFPRAI
jgi:hypothetical protein